ncbi:Protein of uncharacterised function (DUF1642) [Streptococcus pneumoniae]|nr:Protein of uncharacterised function (DUF1642) [Streptococcus pneumoniae]
MNKQELIEKYKNILKESAPFTTTIIHDILEDLHQLDEPEKVKIPQFVAKFIAEQKELGHTLSYSIDASMSDRVAEWYWDNSELFARAWLDGYEIQGRKYVVTDGNHLYFKNYQEDIEIVILVDEQPGTMEYVKKFNTKEEAQEAADILGWKVQEVE